MMTSWRSQQARRFNFRELCPSFSASKKRLSSFTAWGFLLAITAALLLFAPHAGAQVTWGNPVWSDEFNGAAGVFTPTSSNNLWWTFDTGTGFGTGEIEQMISDGTTSYLDGNGHLVIKTYQTGTTYYSARFKSKLNGSFGKEFTYGRVESSIQIPTSQGIWPAFWMLGDISGTGWPTEGEIDILENNGSKPLQYRATIHGSGYANTGLGTHGFSTNGFYLAYHTYGVIWGPYLIQFYLDDPVNGIIQSYTPGTIMGLGMNGTASTLGQWDFYNHPEYIIYDVAVGGGFPGPPGAGTIMPQYENIDYVRVYQVPAPGAPTALAATANSNSQVQLTWGASNTADANVTYNIFRSTTAGTEHSSVSDSNWTDMISTGVTGTSFTDTMLTPGTTYHYEVTASGQESGESAVSNEATVTMPSTGTNAQAIAISSGSLVGSDKFVQDTGYALGASNADPDPVDVSKVTNPAPQGVYRSERWGPTTYTFADLTPGASFTVRLHFNETAVTVAGGRHFNVAINGTTVLPNFDIFNATGGEYIANIQQFTATADSTGKITVAFTVGTGGTKSNNPSIRGIEVIPASGGGCTAAPAAPTGLGATAASSSQINLAWTASTAGSGCTVTGYNVFRSTTTPFTPSTSNQVATGVSGTSFSDTGLLASTTYYYQVEATDSFGSSAASNQAQATTQANAGCTAAPSAPTGLTATTASSSQVNLSWTASTPPSGCSITYSITRNSASIATGVTGTTYSNTGLTCNTAYTYTVAAVDSFGSSGASNSASATTSACPVTAIQINSGGPAVSPFVADVDFVGGTTINHANTIDLSGVTNPAPMAVYQTARTGTSTYTIPGFTAGSSHTVRLHFAETYFTAAGSRTFNVSINGTQVLAAFDIFKTAGAKNKAVIEQFTENANSSGQYVIAFSNVVNQALISGIEVQ